MNQYKHNIKQLSDIGVQQDTVLNELAAIENELDNILPQYETDPEVSNALRLVHERASANNAEAPLRQQVFANAKKLDHEIDGLNGQLSSVQQTIDHLMMRNSPNARSECLGMALGGASGLNNSTLQSTKDIEQILNSYYQALKWIQGTAVDLQFQTQEIEQKIQTQLK